MATCNLHGCNEPHFGRGYCNKHWQRWRRHGDPLKSGHKVRPLRVDGNLAIVPLSQGLHATIDAADAPHVAGRNWHAVRDGNTYYAMTSVKGEDGRHHKIPLHRFIVNPPSGCLVDHGDGDGLNNRRANLRVATLSENQWNKARSRNNTSGFKGVRLAGWTSGSKRWRATIFYDGKHHCLGYHQTPEDAARAYDEAALIAFGEFARLNGALVQEPAHG